MQAATGIPAIIVLLVVMNWFFHRVYWTGWISHHHKRRRGLLARRAATPRCAARCSGLGLLGFTSVYREGFEIVVFLQNLRVTFGVGVVLEGVMLGLLFTAAVGVLTFALHQRLPYKRLLIITGAMLLVVLFVMVGEEVNEMQLAGWIGTTAIGLHFPGWAGTWFSLFPNVETIVAQALAVIVVLGSYLPRSTCACGDRAAVACRRRISPSGHPSARPDPRSVKPPARWRSSEPLPAWRSGLVVPLLVSAICLSLLFGGHAATTTVDTAFRGTPAVDPKLASYHFARKAGDNVGRSNFGGYGYFDCVPRRHPRAYGRVAGRQRTVGPRALACDVHPSPGPGVGGPGCRGGGRHHAQQRLSTQGGIPQGR